jgi:hypothetical protein
LLFLPVFLAIIDASSLRRRAGASWHTRHCQVTANFAFR